MFKFENTNTNKEKVSNHDPVPQVSELRSSKPAMCCCAKRCQRHVRHWVDGRGSGGSARCVLSCEDVWSILGKDVKNAHTRVDHREGEREGRHHLVCSSTAARVAVRSSGCFTLGTAPKKCNSLSPWLRCFCSSKTKSGMTGMFIHFTTKLPLFAT